MADRPGAGRAAAGRVRGPTLGDFLRNWCHRDSGAGWNPTSGCATRGRTPPPSRTASGSGQYHGTHAPVVIWYSPKMLDWLRKNRPLDDEGRELAPPADAEPVPAGAVMVKEMFEPPAAECAGGRACTRLLPTSGAAVMVRDTGGLPRRLVLGLVRLERLGPGLAGRAGGPAAVHGLRPVLRELPRLRRGRADLRRPREHRGEPGGPLVFLSQHFFDAEPPDEPPPAGGPAPGRPGAPRPAPLRLLAGVRPLAARRRTSPGRLGRRSRSMPPQTYDNVWVEATRGTPTAASEFVTSDQCLGCHDAGGTGLQFDMTVPNPLATSGGADSSTCRPTPPGAPRPWGWAAATRSSSPSSPARSTPSTPRATCRR